MTHHQGHSATDLRWFFQPPRNLVALLLFLLLVLGTSVLIITELLSLNSNVQSLQSEIPRAAAMPERTSDVLFQEIQASQQTISIRAVILSSFIAIMSLVFGIPTLVLFLAQARASSELNRLTLLMMIIQHIGELRSYLVSTNQTEALVHLNSLYKDIRDMARLTAKHFPRHELDRLIAILGGIIAFEIGDQE